MGKEVVVQYIHRLNFYFIFAFIPKLCYLYKCVDILGNYRDINIIVCINLIDLIKHSAMLKRCMKLYINQFRVFVYFLQVITFKVRSFNFCSSKQTCSVRMFALYSEEKVFFASIISHFSKLLRKLSTRTKYT